MIRKLRTKFIIMAMIAVFVLLGIVVAGMNLVNYRAVVDDARDTLEVLSGNKGALPDFGAPGGAGFPVRPDGDDADGTDTDDDHTPFDGDGKRGPFPRFGKSAEAFFESRFFSVLFDADGNVLASNTRDIFMVTDEEAAELAKQIFSENRSEGFSGDYLFLKSEEEDGTRITFLDCGRKLASARTFLLISLIAAACGYVIFFFVIFFYSKRITKPVAESYEKQKRFITDAGHEIKTPLAIIKADADVLEMDLPENEWLEDIQKQTTRLTALTNDLVSLARMEEAGQSLQKTELNLSELVEEEASAYHMLAQAGEKELQVNIQPAISISGDEKALRRLVNILLDNAMKYSPEKTAVSLQLSKSGRQIRLAVSNRTEAEISEKELELLFDRFYRLDASRNSETGGHGIGLSMAKAITEAHSGKIAASSEDGHSLTMNVTFPA